MKEILQAILGFCAAAIFIGAVSLLAPAKNMSKPTKYVISLVFIVTTVSLFSVIGSTKTPVFSKTTNTIQGEEILSYQTEYLCGALLKDNGIPYQKISVNTNIEQDGSIYISVITVYSNAEPSRIEGIIKEAFETERVEVIND